MTAPLYNTVILRLASTIPHAERLAEPHGTSERRSPVCGSRVMVDVRLDDEGRVVELGQLVRACALGQASASLMGSAAIGRTAEELGEARDALAAWLAGERDNAGEWPGMQWLEPARGYPARHASIRLAFEAVAEAAENARHLVRTG
jgi:NifU-like protein involved in Fe-S cluster formation